MRKDSSYIGAEDIEVKGEEKRLLIEARLFVLISVCCVVFLLAHREILRGYFKARGFSLLSGIFMTLILSPFGAHLIAKILAFFWERLKCAIRSSEN